MKGWAGPRPGPHDLRTETSLSLTGNPTVIQQLSNCPAALSQNKLRITLVLFRLRGTDVSGIPIGSIFRGFQNQAVHKRLYPYFL